MAYFHASREDLGATFDFDAGGYYEQVRDDGTVTRNNSPTGFAGFKTSSVPELAASKTPEGALFAQLLNIAQPAGIPPNMTVPVTIYRLARDPDIEISTVGGDFTITEEVRYRNPEENPIHGVRCRKVQVPSNAVNDVFYAYLPPNPHIIQDWAKAVKNGLEMLIADGEYPPIADTFDVPEPDPDAYKNARRV